MNYIIFDLEWNQAFSPDTMKMRPFCLRGEIIQIGAVKLNEGLSYIDSFKIGVKPKYYKRMEPRVQRITGINNHLLSLGVPFPAAYQHFRDWCGPDCTFLTWGPSDLPMLQSNLQLHNLSRKHLPPFYDLQRIFNILVTHEQRQWGLPAAMERLELATDLDPHDALHDALNTARICQTLDLAKGIALYAEPDDIWLVNARQGVAVFSEFSSLNAAIKDWRVRAVPCPTCGQAMGLTPWVKQCVGKRIAMAVCPAHGEYLIRLKSKRQDDRTLRICRLVHPATDELKARYLETRASKEGASRSLST